MLPTRAHRNGRAPEMSETGARAPDSTFRCSGREAIALESRAMLALDSLCRRFPALGIQCRARCVRSNPTTNLDVRVTPARAQKRRLQRYASAPRAARCRLG